MSFNSKMTTIADEIRDLSGTNQPMGLDAMINTLERIVPEISVNSSNGIVTAMVGVKKTEHQLAFQPAKTITPSAASQIAVSSGYYTGGNITVKAIPSQYVIPSGTLTISTNGTHDVKNYASAVINVEGGGGSSGEAAEWSENEDAMITGTLSNYTNDRVTRIGAYALYGCGSLATVNFPACTTIGYNAFYSCRSLTTVNFPACTSISAGAFHYCRSLTTVSFPVCTTIGDDAFHSCHSLVMISFPACTSIGGAAFCSCGTLTTANFPVCTIIDNYAFSACQSLVTANFPACATISDYAFSSCNSLVIASFPACTSISTGAFYYCRSLTTANFPVCTIIGSSAFCSCRSLVMASFPACTTISSSAFTKCYNLKSLYLTGSSVCKLSNSYVFSSTPIGGYIASAGTYGQIYVPSSLVASYKAATNWTYFSSRIVAYDSGNSGGAGD